MDRKCITAVLLLDLHSAKQVIIKPSSRYLETVVIITDCPKRVRISSNRSRDGITTAIEEEIKIIPTRSAATHPYPNKIARLTPTAKGTAPFINESQIRPPRKLRKFENFVSSPAINIRKTSPICPRNSATGVISKILSACGPIIMPPKINPTTQGKCMRRKTIEKNTPTKIIRKNG